MFPYSANSDTVTTLDSTSSSWWFDNVYDGYTGLRSDLQHELLGWIVFAPRLDSFLDLPFDLTLLFLR